MSAIDFPDEEEGRLHVYMILHDTGVYEIECQFHLDLHEPANG